ncbi:MAG: ABC transporter permease [Kiritimatiellia bacterium]
MSRYILRRLLHMIPALAGVILLTFVLFNVVGGSPATMVLGMHATAQALEDYEFARGYNLPLFFGCEIKTRAFEDLDAARAASLWKHDDAVLPKGTYELPLAFDCAGKIRWKFRGRVTGTASIVCERLTGEKTAVPLRRLAKFKALPGDRYSIAVEQGAVDIRGLRLRKVQWNPFNSQLFLYLRQLARLDFGMSLDANQKVSTLLKSGIVPSLCLTVPILFGGTAVALVMALLCAYFRDRFFDRLLVVLATVLMSVNYIIWVIAGQYFFAYRLEWFPIWGFESWRFLLLPVFIGIVTGLGRDVRFYRTVILDEMYKDYVRTARAKGVSPAGILARHVLPNAMVPVLTNVSISIPYLFTGSLLLESFFGIPGLGNLSINAINSSDFDVIRAVVLIGAGVYVVVNLITDLCYAWVDPRVRLK